jgi:tetratricopeptide (TPR) repeat protein
MGQAAVRVDILHKNRVIHESWVLVTAGENTMPFIKKTHSQDSRPSLVSVSPTFIGRTGELLFFVHNILKPEAPTHNILSISGQGGVGKSTLLARFIEEAHEAPFKDYCLTALIDERQATPIGMMEKFAQQLHMAGEFEKVLKQYKEVLRKRQVERETLRDTLLERAPDVAGAVVEGIPVAGPLLREGVKAASMHLLKEYQASQVQQDTELLETPVDDLTRAFVTELNRLADAKVPLSSTWEKRQRRIVLFFDTFEQLAAEAAPWFLDHFLDTQVSSNVVLVVAGRDPIEHTSPDDPKRWLPYCDDGTIYWMSLNSFTEDETRTYLVKKGITDGDQIATIWQLSRGLPLYLGLLTSNPQGNIDPTKDVIVNFLRWIPEQEHIKRQLALDAALLSSPFNQDDLEVFSYVPESERVPLYQWLTGQPFVRSRAQDGRHLYHDVACYLFSRHLYQRSQKHYYQIRRALVMYYQELLENIQAERGQEVFSSKEWLELFLAEVSQLLLLPDQASHIKAIEHILQAYDRDIDGEQNIAIARALRGLSQEPSPHHISPAARKIAIHLLQYVDATFSSQESLAAADALLEKVAHAPSFPSELLVGIYRRRGRIYNYLQEKELARENFQQALKLLEPTNYRVRGKVYQESGDYRGALASQNRALEQNPHDVSAYISRGWAYTYLGENQLAIADFDHALQLDPKNTDVHNSRGWAHYYAGEYQQARESFEYLLELKPDHAAALRGLSLNVWCEIERT